MTFTLARAADVSPGDTVLHGNRPHRVSDCREIPGVLQFVFDDGLSVLRLDRMDVSMVSP